MADYFENEFRLLKAGETEHHETVQRIIDALQHANEAIREAVNAGISVEVIRVSRHHDSGGNWGDQLAPAIRQAPRE